MSLNKMERSSRLNSLSKEIEKLKSDIEHEREERSDDLQKVLDTRVPPPPNVDLQEVRRLPGHYGKIYAMDWSGDSEHILSASQEGKLVIWNGRMGVKTSAISLQTAWVMACAYEQRENELVACGGLDNICTIYPAINAIDSNTSPAPLKELAAHEGYVSSCKFVDTRTILTSSGDSTCILWDIETGGQHKVFYDHQGDVMSVCVSPNNPFIFVSGSCDATAKVWDIREGGCVRSFNAHETDINAVRFMSNGYCFGTASDDARSKLFDIRASTRLNVFSDERVICGMTCIDFSKSGRLAIVGNDDKFCTVWDTLSTLGTPYAMLAGHTSRVSCLGVNKTGTALCTGSWDRSLIVYA